MKNVLLFSLLASLFLLANGCVNDPYYDDGYYDAPRGHRPPPPPGHRAPDRKPDYRPAPPPAQRPEARPPQRPDHRPAPGPSHDAPRPEPRHRT